MFVDSRSTLANWFEAKVYAGYGHLLPASGLCAILLTLPIVVRLPVPILDGRLTLLEPITILTFAVWFLYRARAGERLDLCPRVYVPLLAFLGAGFLSVLVARNANAALVELATYVNGALLLFLVHQIMTRSERGLRLGFAGLLTGAGAAIGAAAIGVGAILLRFPLPVLTSDTGKLVGTFMAPNQLPSYMLVILPLMLYMAMRRRTVLLRVLAGCGALAAALSIMATGSRSGVIAVAVIGFGYAFWRSRKKLRVVLILVALAIGVLLGSVAGVFDRGLGPLGRSLTVFEDASSYIAAPERADTVRFRNLQAWAEIARTRPLLGVGVGNFRILFTEIIPEAPRGFELHNAFLSVWAEMGLMGFIPFMIFLWPFGMIGLRCLIRWPTNPIEECRAALAFGILGNLIHQGFHMGLRQPIFWVGLGLLLALDCVARRGEPEKLVAGGGAA